MKAVDALCAALVRFAVGRWPRELRTEMERAWDAELRALALDSSLRPLTRSYQQLRFATSLAVSRPAERLGERTRWRWRETILGSFGRLGWSLAWLVAPLLGAEVVKVLVFTTQLVPQSIGSIFNRGLDPDAALQAVVVNGLSLVIGFSVVTLIGRQLGRWSAPRAGLLGPVVILAVGTLIGAYVFAASARSGADVYWGRGGLAAAAAGITAWLVLSVVLILFVRRLGGASRRRRLVSVLGVVVGLVFADIAVAAACMPILVVHHGNPAYAFVWLPQATTRNEGPLMYLGILTGNRALESLAILLLTATALVLGAALTKPAQAERAAQQTKVASVPRPSNALRTFGFVCMGLALAVWVPTLAFLTSAQKVRVETDWAEEQSQYLAWAHDLRNAAIVLVVLGLVAVMAPLGRAVIGAVVAAVVLLAVDAVLDVRQIAGADAALVCGAAGLSVIAAAWGFSRVFLDRRASEPMRHRRMLAGAAVVAAYCAPALLVRGGWGPPAYKAIPAGLAEATALVTALLVGLAAALAVSAREAPLPARRFGVLVAGPAFAAGAYFYAATFGGLQMTVVGILGPAFAVVLLAFARGRTEGQSMKRFVMSVVLLGIGGTIAALPLLLIGVFLPGLVAEGIDLGGDHSGDSFSVLPGAAVIGVLLALVAVPIALRSAGRSARQPEVAALANPATLETGLG